MDKNKFKEIIKKTNIGLILVIVYHLNKIIAKIEEKLQKTKK